MKCQLLNSHEEGPQEPNHSGEQKHFSTKDHDSQYSIGSW